MFSFTQAIQRIIIIYKHYQYQIVYFIKKTILGVILNSIIISQTISIKGMFTLSSLTSNDVPSGWSSYESDIGYIPTLSIKQHLSNKVLLDAEWAYYLKNNYTGDSLYNTLYNNHRLWIRYSNEKIEARLGLQKIVFGPTQILRSLSWFDTFDLKDPTGQTDGVESFRLRLFPSNNISIWSWIINNNLDTLSYGGRAELSLTIGEIGLTFHIDPANSAQSIGQIGTPIYGSHNRTAIDFRYDGYIGFWNESVLIKSDRSQIMMSTIGADYTIPAGGGILVMAEAMYSSNKYEIQNTNQNYSSIMASLPIGIIHMAMYISQFDWTEEKIYHYLRWSSTFDSYSLNMILSLNPKRNQYNIIESNLPKSLSGFGMGIQFMFIYNH